MLIESKLVDTLKVSFENKSLIKTSPNFYLIDASSQSRNFGVNLLPNVNDLRINLTSVTPPRPGFPNTYGMTYKNVGSAVANGKIFFVYNAKQTLVSALPAPTTNVNQTLTWNYANLQANESRDIKLTMKTAVDAPIRSQITNVATIDPLSRYALSECLVATELALRVTSSSRCLAAERIPASISSEHSKARSSSFAGKTVTKSTSGAAKAIGSRFPSRQVVASVVPGPYRSTPGAALPR